MLKMRERLLTRAVAACVLALCAGPVFAALTVEIIQPDTDPFTSMVDNPAYFEAVAYIDGQELPGGEVTWDWDFGDQTAHSADNPTTHTFTEVGEYTVMVTASHDGQQGQDTAIAIVEEPEPSPGTGSISIYVAHDGTWLNYNTGEYEEAEIEDEVAVFLPGETFSDDFEDWCAHQVNDPKPPAGWGFFAPASPMELHVIIADTQNQLGEVEIRNRDTGELLGTLEANEGGSEIEGRLAISPAIEGFRLDVKDTAANTLLVAGANTPQIIDVVLFTHEYAWQPNRGDEHECPAVPELGPPYGDPNSLQDAEGHKKSVAFVETRACNGPKDYENDREGVLHVRGKYELLTKRKRQDDTEGFEPPKMPADPAQEIITAINNARDQWDGGTGLEQEYTAPPFSRGTVHFPVGAQGGLTIILYFRYKGHRDWKPQITTQLGEHLVWEEGIGHIRPLGAVIAAFTWPSEQVKKRCGGPVEVGEVWGLTAWSDGTPDCWAQGITAPVTFELKTDIPDELTAGTGSAEVDTAWTTPSPPPVMYSPLDLTFGEEGTCTVDLAKGWKWKAKGQPSQYYTEGTVDPFNVPCEGTKTILCHLQALLCLNVETKDPEGNPAEADVELYQRGPGGGYPPGPTLSGRTSDVNGHQIWSTGPLTLGTYKARAKATVGPDPQWVWWSQGGDPEFEIVAGLLEEMTITVDPGEMEP